MQGVPALGLPPLKPLFGKEFVIEEGPGELHLSFKMRNITVNGLEDYVFTGAKIDLQKPYIELKMRTKITHFQGNYVFGGHLLTLSISGDGFGEVEFGGLDVTNRIYLKEEKRNGNVYWKVTEYLYDMNPEYIKVNFRNLFKGNKRLGMYANQFINSNWKPLYQFYNRGTVAAFGTPMKDYANILLSKIPISDLFLH